MALFSVHVLPVALVALARQPIPLPLALTPGIAVIVYTTMATVDRLARRRFRVAGGVAVAGLASVFLAGLFGVAAGYAAHMDFFARFLTQLDPPWAGPGKPLIYFGLSTGMGLFSVGTWTLSVVLPATWEEQRVRDLEVDNLRLETAELRTSAELARLRAQLEPHFLLNTLNLIAGLVDSDAEKARQILACLGDLLRDALVAQGELHQIGDEVAWLRRYCQILEMRHGHALSITWRVDDAASSATIPRLLLQPLVENAIQHGALRRRGGGHVIIAIVADRERLSCVIEDDGPGIVGEPRDAAIGVANVRRRLALTCAGSRFALERGDGFTRAVVELPIRLPPAPEESA